MNSSTSNFRKELKVVLVVMGALLITELDVRRQEGRFWDTAHVRSMTKGGADLCRTDAPGTLFLGNSLFRSGVDTELIGQEMRAKGSKPGGFLKLTPSASSIGEWYYYLNTYFVQPGHRPGLLVLGFANDHLSDEKKVPPVRLGGYSCRLADTPQVFAEDLHDFGDRVEFLEAMASSSISNRDWIRRAVLHQIVPNYVETAAYLNASVRRQNIAHAEPPKATYQRLQRFLNLARDNHIPIVLVAMPTETHYHVDPAVEQIAQASGATLLDYRAVEGLSRGHFTDPLHLNAEGARIFSRYMAAHLISRTSALAASAHKNPAYPRPD